LHILYLHQHFSPTDGYGNNRSLEIAEEWVKAGNRVTIICGKGNFKNIGFSFALYHTLMINGINIIRLNIGYSHFYSFTRRIISFLSYLFVVPLLSFQVKNADVVYASSTPLSVGLLGIWFKKVFNQKFIFEIVDLWPDVPIEMGIIKNKWLQKFVLQVEKATYNQAHSIICLSEGMKERIIQKGIPRDKIKIAHNGTNCTLFFPSKDKANAKQTLGYAKDDFLVLYAGTIGIANGLEFLVDIAVTLNEPSIKFLILGNGNSEQKVKEYALLKQVNNLAFINYVPKYLVRTYFDAANVGMVTFAQYPILETNSANKFFDYLASGLPVLINYNGWQKQYLNKYQCGMSCTNSDDMAAYIQYLFENQNIVLQMGKNARNLAVDKFERVKIANSIAELFKL